MQSCGCSHGTPAGALRRRNAWPPTIAIAHAMAADDGSGTAVSTRDDSRQRHLGAAAELLDGIEKQRNIGKRVAAVADPCRP